MLVLTLIAGPAPGKGFPHRTAAEAEQKQQPDRFTPS